MGYYYWIYGNIRVHYALRVIEVVGRNLCAVVGRGYESVGMHAMYFGSGGRCADN